jgi:cytochrome c oxidase assembly protein subunit 15
MSTALSGLHADLTASTRATPRWLHFWAVITAAATFVLLALGAMVTTFQAGMADPIWPTYPWHLLLIPWQNADARFLIEHSHRLAGYIVGCCTIVLAVGLWRREPRPWLRWLGLAALAGVIVQGLIGGFRVKLNEWLGTDLAMTHGIFASVVFSTMVVIAVATSSSWLSSEGTAQPYTGAHRLRGLSVAVAVLILCQIALGAVLRHQYSTLGQRGHILMAFAVVFSVTWLSRDVLATFVGTPALRVPVLMLAVLLGAQLLLGVEAWMLRYLAPSHVAVQALIRTSHVLVGYASLATAVVVSMQIHRATRSSGVTTVWEGAL